jgi:hypothetical protein
VEAYLFLLGGDDKEAGELECVFLSGAPGPFAEAEKLLELVRIKQCFEARVQTARHRESFHQALLAAI